MFKGELLSKWIRAQIPFIKKHFNLQEISYGLIICSLDLKTFITSLGIITSIPQVPTFVANGQFEFLQS